MACSGGPDSLALLALAAQAGLDPMAVHVDHGARPASETEGGLVEGFADLHEASGQRPAQWRMGSADEHDPVASLQAALLQCRGDTLRLVVEARVAEVLLGLVLVLGDERDAGLLLELRRRRPGVQHGGMQRLEILGPRRHPPPGAGAEVVPLEIRRKGRTEDPGDLVVHHPSLANAMRNSVRAFDGAITLST